MILKIGSEKLKITHNYRNKFWKPAGRFYNISEIQINDDWYNCSLNIITKDSKTFIQFIHPMKVDEMSSRILKVYHEGIYAELPISIISKNVIQYLLGIHELNYSFYALKMFIYKNMNSIIVFTLALFLSAIFYFVNKNWNNVLIDFIAKNLWSQTIIMFLTLASFINIFYPFALRKEINHKDVVQISKDTIAKQKKEDKENEVLRRYTTF